MAITSAQLATWQEQDLAEMRAAGYNPELIDCEPLTDDDIDWTPEQEASWVMDDKIAMFRNEY